jgi:pimeloyl-ACP methyl ester carboxylesterase
VKETRVIQLVDGRHLAWVEVGAPDGAAVVGFHGTPGTRRQMLAVEPAVRAVGVRLIAVDRPGYGLSSFQAGRRLGDWPKDVEQLADHLGLLGFGVIGISGGGPHALVCAAHLPGRVTVAGIISGVGPLSSPGAEDGMLAVSRLVSRVGRRSTVPLSLLFGLVTMAQRRWPEKATAAMARQVPPVDAEIMARPEVREIFLKEARDASATTGRASAQDFQVFAQPWDFSLEEIRVPVHLWQGDADRNVPPAHARGMAAVIPGATLHEVPGAGHMMVFDRAQEILETLRPYL